MLKYKVSQFANIVCIHIKENSVALFWSVRRWNMTFSFRDWEQQKQQAEDRSSQRPLQHYIQDSRTVIQAWYDQFLWQKTRISIRTTERLSMLYCLSRIVYEEGQRGTTEWKHTLWTVCCDTNTLRYSRGAHTSTRWRGQDFRIGPRWRLRSHAVLQNLTCPFRHAWHWRLLTYWSSCGVLINWDCT